MIPPPANPCACPKCGEPSPCTDWNEVDIGVGVQTFDHVYTCPRHGDFAFSLYTHRAAFRDDDG